MAAKKARKSKAKKRKAAKKTGRRATAGAAAPAMKWSNNNGACLAVWGALLVLAQIDRAFAVAGGLRVGTFPQWVPGEARPVRERRARQLASQLDNLFRALNGADYEPGHSKASALSAMTSVLVDDDETVTDLADAVDDVYRFLDEADA